MRKRRLAREMAVQMLYQGDLGGAGWRQVAAAFDPVEHLILQENGTAEDIARRRSALSADGEIDVALEYATRLLQGTSENLETIDDMIRRQADHWRLERMPAVDRNIIRLAVYELLYETEVPQLVIVDEAIELAKAFGSERSSSFVNGLLDGLLKHHEFPGSRT